MIQSTSKEAYNKIVDDLGQRQRQVYNVLWAIEPACNKSIALKMSMPINEITPRINELRYKGVVEQAFKADYDGRKVIFWKIKHPEINWIQKELL
jgi:hypothetical protein